MTADHIARAFLLAFAGLFFVYLFAPLAVMGITAFNSSAFPRVAPFECFSVEWFGVLASDAKLMRGLANSLVIGLGVVVLAVPIGMAGALLLSQVPDRARPWYYTVAISPILIPGVVLGISTLVFWDRLGRMFGAGEESVFYNGVFLTIAGQTTFVAAYCMLIFIARLQRFEAAQEEAAWDLGATPGQSFRKVLLPFLKPAIGSAAVLAFLASFENYNTTVFTSLTSETLVTVLASKVRHGINPSISALAVIIVALTLAGAIAYEILKRREAKGKVGRSMGDRSGKAARMLNPALVVFALICVVGVGTIYLAGTVGLEECKVAVQEEKRRRAAERIEALRRARQEREATASPESSVAPRENGNRRREETPSIFAPDSIEVPRRSTRTNGDDPKDDERDARPANPFAPENLGP